MSELYFIRHGQANFGHDEYDRLSERGGEQIRTTAGYFLERKIIPDALYSGTLARQTASAEIFAAECAVRGVALPDRTSIEGLNEHDSARIVKALLPRMAGRDPSLSADMARIYTDNSSFQRVFERTMIAWISGAESVESVELWEEFRGRVNESIRIIMRACGRSGRIAVFSSGGPIGCAAGLALDLSDEHTLRLSWQVVNASVTKFVFSGERISLSYFNMYAHLESADGSTLVTYR